MTHPLFERVRATLQDAIDAGTLDAATLATWLTALGHGDRSSLPEGAVGEAARKLGWLLFAYAPAADPRFIVMATMSVADLGTGRRGLRELLAELADLPADVGALDGMLTADAAAVDALLAEAQGAEARATEKLGAMADEVARQAHAAAAEGRWEDVPIPGPDADAVRGALAALEPADALAVLEAWVAAGEANGEGRFDDAIATLTEAAKRAPDVFETWVRRARAYFGQGDRIRAGADLQRALELHPASAAARAMRAELRALIRDLKGSLEDWSAALANHPDHVPYLTGRAFTKVAAGDLAGAKRDLEAAVAAQPDDPGTRYNLADVLVRLGDVPAAIAQYDTLLAGAPEDAQALMNRGTAKLMLRDVDGAIEDFSFVQAKQPANAMAWAKRGAAEVSRKGTWRAWLDCVTALAVAEPEWEPAEQVETLAGQAVQALGAPGAAKPDPGDLAQRFKILAERVGGQAVIALADAVSRFQPGEAIHWHLLRAAAYLDYGKWAAAAGAAREGLAVDAHNPLAHLALGRARLGEGDVASALASLDEALKGAVALDPISRFHLHLSRGRALGATGRLDEAVLAFDAAAQADDKRADAWFYKGVHLDLLGRPEEAVAAYDGCIARDEAFAPGWFNRACEHAVLGHADDALRDLERAIQLESKWKEAARTEQYFESLHGLRAFDALIA